jgi:hypothetical protein
MGNQPYPSSGRWIFNTSIIFIMAEKLINSGDLIRKRSIKGINVNIDGDSIQIMYNEWLEINDEKIIDSIQVKSYIRSFTAFSKLPQVTSLMDMINLDLQRDNPQ